MTRAGRLGYFLLARQHRTRAHVHCDHVADTWLSFASTLILAVTEDFDYCFAENGLTAYKLGEQLESQSFIKFIGEEKYKKLVKFILHYIADMDIPIKR